MLIEVSAKLRQNSS